MATALIVSASHGIGLELARQYRADGWRVIATVRQSDEADQLRLLGAEVHVLETANVEQCAALAWNLDDERLDLAILCADAGNQLPGGLNTPTQAVFDRVMHGTVLAAMRLLPIVAPLVASVRGKLALVSAPPATPLAAADWLCRAKEAALDSLLTDSAAHFGAHGAICVSLHAERGNHARPGPPPSREAAAQAIRMALAALTTADNGRLLRYRGTVAVER